MEIKFIRSHQISMICMALLNLLTIKCLFLKQRRLFIFVSVVTMTTELTFIKTLSSSHPPYPHPPIPTPHFHSATHPIHFPASHLFPPPHFPPSPTHLSHPFHAHLSARPSTSPSTIPPTSHAAPPHPPSPRPSPPSDHFLHP